MRPESMESVPCPCGASGEDVRVLDGTDRLHGIEGRFTVVRCRACGLMRTNPRPIPDAIGAYYPADYGPYLSTQVTPGGSTALKWMRRIFRRIVETNATRLPSVRPGRALEIGSASGGFLQFLSDSGWSVEGIEFSPEAAARAREAGFEVFAGRVEDAPDPVHRFDLLVGWMVVEHLHDPVTVLRKLRRWSSPDAWLVLSMPNAGSAEARIFGDAWYALQLPTHLYHYTPATISALLGATGWNVERILHQRTMANLIASIGYRLLDRNPSSRLGSLLRDFPERGGRLAYLLFPVAYLLSMFGQTGRMTVWARPRKAERRGEASE
jgi:2-polyprenyl-3-methyl-5-hydroxy-6-metoxy-1,4-benzoquinol methylase